MAAPRQHCQTRNCQPNTHPLHRKSPLERHAIAGYLTLAGELVGVCLLCRIHLDLFALESCFALHIGHHQSVAASSAALIDFPLFGFQLPELASFRPEDVLWFCNVFSSAVSLSNCEFCRPAAFKAPECYRGLSGSIADTTDHSWSLRNSRESCFESPIHIAHRV